MERFLFVGPTAFGVCTEKLSSSHQIKVLPPVRRGDIDELVQINPNPGEIIIVDGTFHSYPSVSHKEIRNAIDRDWVVVGLSSMGAIRAAELEMFGMQGYGSVFEKYRSDPDFDDDEVTLIHGACSPYIHVSEPMIHFRNAIDYLYRKEQIDEKKRDLIIANLKERWYGYRTMRLFKEELRRASISADVIDYVLNNFEQFRCKSSDFKKYFKI